MECNKDFNTRDCKSVADVNCAPAPSRPNKTSFWTQCSACQIKFEYSIYYLNKQLRCRSPICCKSYVPIEIPPPPIDGNSNVHSLVGRQTSPTNAGSTSFSGIHLPEKLTSSYGKLTKFASDKAAPATASYSPLLGVLELVVRHQKSGREEAAAAVAKNCSVVIEISKKAHTGSVGMSFDVNSRKTEVIRKSRVGEGGTDNKVTEDASEAAFVNGRGLGTQSTSGS